MTYVLSRPQVLLHRRAVRRLVDRPGLAGGRLGRRADRGDARSRWRSCPATRRGVQIVDDWDGMGQRTTASGTVTLDDVPVPPNTSCRSPRSSPGPASTAPTPSCCTPPSTSASPPARWPRAFARPPRPGPTSRPGWTRQPRIPPLIQVAGELVVTVRGARGAARRGGAARRRRPREPHRGHGGRRRRWPWRSPRSPQYARRWRPSNVLFELGGTRSASAAGTSPATGVTPAPTRCTMRPGGSSSTSAGTPCPAPDRPATARSET